MLCYAKQFVRQSQLWDFGEIACFVPHLVTVAKRYPPHPIAHRFDNDRPLPSGKDHATHAYDPLRSHRIPDHRECLFSERVARYDIVRRIEIASVELGARNEAVDLNRSIIFNWAWSSSGRT